jgi:hypothetical protein
MTSGGSTITFTRCAGAQVGEQQPPASEEELLEAESATGATRLGAAMAS